MFVCFFFLKKEIYTKCKQNAIDVPHGMKEKVGEGK